MAEKEERPSAAFILSLLGGVFILLGGGVRSLFGFGGWGMMGGYTGYGGYRGWGGMMGGYPSYGYGMMGGLGFGTFGILGLIFGAIVIVSALMLNRKPEQHSTWGILIVIFSVLSLLGGAMGGFGVGLVLGLIGGILAIT